ncbi:MAG: SpoIIE family protein phosphatase [Solirubrobacteraceae bacterium]
MTSRRTGTDRTATRIIEAGRRLLDLSADTPVADLAAAAGVSRSTFYRHFADRASLLAAIREQRPAEPLEYAERPLATGRLGREGPVPLEGIHVFDVVAPPVLPEQLAAEAQRIAEVPVALYVIDIDGSHLLRVAGPERLPDQIEVPLAIGPELDAKGLAELRRGLADRPGVEVVPLWLRGRSIGVMLTLGRPRRPLTELARQAAAAITLADRYTDTFARAQRRIRPLPGAEIQQSLLPPRISRVSGGEVAGNVLPSYEVAGDWYDVVENLDGIWITLADGLGPSTRAAASSAVALGALRAARRSGAGAHEAMMLMHRTLREMPGPAAAMTAVAARWDPTTFRLEIVNCGQVKPIVIRADEQIEVIDIPVGHGLGGRAGPRPARRETTLAPGDRLIICSDGVIHDGTGRAGLDYDGVSAAALQSDDGSAADTVREVHKAALAASSESLRDDATVVCLAVE